MAMTISKLISHLESNFSPDDLVTGVIYSKDDLLAAPNKKVTDDVVEKIWNDKIVVSAEISVDISQRGVLENLVGLFYEIQDEYLKNERKQNGHSDSE